MSMAIASDVDETSTGSSGHPVENEDTNMLAESSGSNQIDCTVHHYYEKLKDFAFDMPGGWTDATISLFIDTFKLYKDDFSRPHPDELKIWQKVVKRCVERSNNHKVFTVNSVMELAGSLKSHVLRNEYRKDDETFKVLYNDVVDIIPYFPNTTCDSVSQNLRLRSRTHEVKTFSSTTDTSSIPVDIDNLILKYCEELNLRAERYFSNSNWNNIASMMLKNHGIRVDIVKHLGDIKRKLVRDLKDEEDLVKKKSTFYETIGPFKPYFDLMPPRTVKIIDFDVDFKLAPSNGVTSESSSDDNSEAVESQKSVPCPSEGPRVYRRATPKKVRPGKSSLNHFPRIRKILGITDSMYSSESDEPETRKRNLLKNSSRNLDDLSSDSVTSPETSDEIDTDLDNQEVTRSKMPSSRKRSVESQAAPPKSPFKGKTRKNVHSSDEDSSPARNSKAPKRTSLDTSKQSLSSLVFGPNHPRNSKINMKSSTGLSKNDQSRIFTSQAKVELSPLKVGGSVVSITGHNGKKIQKVRQVNTSSRNKKVNFSHRTEVIETIGQSDDGRSAPITSVERVKSKNIVTPINVKMNEKSRQEASTSASYSDHCSTRAENIVQPRSTSSVNQEFNLLERMEENTVRIIEGYKEKVKDAGHSVMQLIPKQHIAIPPVGVSTSTNSDFDFNVQHVCPDKAPGWFDGFVTDYKKHEMWKVHQLFKMQQELLDVENRKLIVLEKIYTSLNERKS